jgi:hypothetical protein
LAAIYDAFTARFAVLAARAFARFATNAAFRAGDSFLFGAFFFGGAACFLEAAHRFRWASPMRFLAAALIFRRLRVDASGVVAVSVEPPGSMARSSAIWPSILVFCEPVDGCDEYFGSEFRWHVARFISILPS